MPVNEYNFSIRRGEENAFNIKETNGTKPLNEWMERGIQDYAKREYGLNITVKVIEVIKTKLEDEKKEA